MRIWLPLLVAFMSISWVARCSAGLTLTISDPIGRVWTDEPIRWEVSCKAGEWRDGSLTLLRDGRPLPAQAVVTERHGDGSVKTAEILFVLDRLEPNGQTVLTAELGKAGPASSDLSIQKRQGVLMLANRHLAVQLLNRNVTNTREGEFSPLLGVRTKSGKWTGGGRYETTTARPIGSQTELLETGPVRLSARVTTTFDNGRQHVMKVSLWAGAREIEIAETFNLGPDEMYRFKEYKSDQDELAWEWWSWYGDTTDPSKDPHPNNWWLTLSSPEFAPKVARYFGEDRSTDPSKTDQGEGYDLTYTQDRMEKILEPIIWWRPDAVAWYAVSPSREPEADVVALCAHSPRDWRNPNVLPTTNITLRTRTNTLRIFSSTKGELSVQCPIGLGQRVWSIRVSDVAESYAQQEPADSALTAANIKHDFGLDVARHWITDWEMTFTYPRLFIKPAEKENYYARLKGVGVRSPGDPLNDFLARQDEASAKRLYESLIEQADRMINGYYTRGVNGYPGWMLGYWHGIVVATGMDNLLGSPLCTPEMARILKKKMAILTYLLTSKDNWPDKQINFGWGSMNMPVGRWGGLVVMASSISDHPAAKDWLRDADRYFRMLLKTEYAPDGTHISCPHYIGASSTSFYAWIALANAGAGPDASRSPELRNFARYYMQLMTPIDKRWGIRTLLTEGDTRPGSSAIPGILATLFKESDPDLAGQLIQIWHEGGEDATSGMGVPDMLIIDPTIPPVPPKLGPEVFPGFGAVLRYRDLGTPEESYLTFLGGDFMIDHANCDQLAFEWYEKGVPLTLYTGDMYVPGATTALSHNTLCWNVRPEGPPTPGKDQPGDWYHDHGLPWVEHTNRPRLHLQIGWDQAKQKITDTRGMVTAAADLAGAAFVEGQVKVLTLTEVPTRADYSPAMMAQIATPLVPIAQPFTWTRRLLYVKAPTAAGMNYLVVRDDQGGFTEYAPSFSYWSLSDDVDLGTREAHFRGQLGVDTDLFVTVPAQVRLFRDSFTHSQCEPIVSARGFQGEKQVVARIEGPPGCDFLVTIFPRLATEPPPGVEAWAGDKGVKLTWQGETHYVLLDTSAQTVDADGIQATASCLVVKVKDANNFSLSLPAGGSVSYAGKRLSGEGPVELTVVNGREAAAEGSDLLAARRPTG